MTVKTSWWTYYVFQLDFKKANPIVSSINNIVKAVNSLSFISNLISCFILAMVVRFINKKIASLQYGKEGVDATFKVNKLVTASHVTITLAFLIV